MKKKILYVLIILILISPGLKVKAAGVETIMETGIIVSEERESFKEKKIKTNYLNLEKETDISFNFKNYTQNELSLFIEGIASETFEDSKTSINFLDKEIDIEFVVNEDDGNLDSLINVGLYNFLSGVRNVFGYDISFDIVGRYKDNNGRYLKRKICTYYYEKETLYGLTYNGNVSNIKSHADKMWMEETGEVINYEKLEDLEKDLNILEIFKYYINEKLK